eukprot:scaffold113831_cov55-Attheya_sp.AAC.2
MDMGNRRRRMGANPPSRSHQPWKLLVVALVVGLAVMFVDATEQVVLVGGEQVVLPAGGAAPPKASPNDVEDDFFTEFQQQQADVPRRVAPKAYQVVDDEDFEDFDDADEDFDDEDFDDEEFLSDFQREEMDDFDNMNEDDLFSGTFAEPQGIPRRMPPKISPQSYDDGETCSNPDVYVREQIYDEDCMEDDDECEFWAKHGVSMYS